MSFVFFANITSAQDWNDDDNIDVMFVLDTSYSMNETDKDKISLEMLKLFTDISYSSHTRIGFVAYNDSIQAFAPLTEVTGKAKEDFKKSLDSIERVGRTDIGLGLKKGLELLDNAKPGRKSFIILLTDGEIDLEAPINQRTVAESLNDANYVVDQAVARKIPIYTVAMGRNGVDLALLESISKKTGVANYVAEAPQDLPAVFNDIFAASFKSRIFPVATVTASGDVQEINIKIPDKYADEADIIFLSPTPLKETQVFYGSANIGFNIARYYSSVKIVKPDQQAVKVRFKSTPPDVVKVSMLLHYNLKSDIEMLGQPRSGQPVTLRSYFIDGSTGQPITDRNLYSAFSAIAVVKNVDTGEEVQIPLMAVDNGWDTDYYFQSKGNYTVSVQANNNFISKMTRAIEANVEDPVSPPRKAEKPGIALPIMAILAIAAMIYYRERVPRPIFEGKINAYYLRLKYPEAEEAPPVSILLANFSDRGKITLFELLRSVQADQGLVEGKQIWFTPGFNQTVVLSHISECNVVVGQTVISKNQRYILHYGDRIYISFPGNNAEIELSYKSVDAPEGCM